MTHVVDRQRQGIVAFANRLPVRRGPRGWRSSDGGLVAALRPALEGRRSTWVGWDPSGEGVPDRVEGLDVALRGVTLTRRQIESSYHGFANRTLWPLLHGLVEQPVFERRWWDDYRTVNHAFARACPDDAGIRWVHDYQLMILPELLRRAAGTSTIGFFLHVPFPAPEVFARLPWRVEVLEGLLGADVVSFHTARYRDNFLRTCALLLDGPVVDGEAIRLEHRAVRTAVNPISVDAAHLGRAATAPGVGRRLAALRRQFEGRRVLLGVDRLDYTKGIPERLRAIELLLEVDRRRRLDLTFVQIAVPSRGDIREYEELRSTVEQLVGRINGRFTERNHDVPIHYLYRGVSAEQLLAYYRLADACLVTPLADGMNLVAKEFVTVQGATEGTGALVLSEFAGAIEELREALPCNPFDVEGLAGTIDLALELTEGDRRDRVMRMSERVARNDVVAWVERELAELTRS